MNIHPHCGISLSKKDLVQFGAELEVMELNQFLGGDSPDIEFLNEQEGSVHPSGLGIGPGLMPLTQQICAAPAVFAGFRL